VDDVLYFPLILSLNISLQQLVLPTLYVLEKTFAGQRTLAVAQASFKPSKTLQTGFHQVMLNKPNSPGRLSVLMHH